MTVTNGDDATTAGVVQGSSSTTSEVRESWAPGTGGERDRDPESSRASSSWEDPDRSRSKCARAERSSKVK